MGKNRGGREGGGEKGGKKVQKDNGPKGNRER